MVRSIRLAILQISGTLMSKTTAYHKELHQALRTRKLISVKPLGFSKRFVNHVHHATIAQGNTIPNGVTEDEAAFIFKQLDMEQAT